MKILTKPLSTTTFIFHLLLLLTLLIPVAIAAQVRGIDVSKYQGTINWTKVAKTKRVSYVYVKATEGTTIQDAYYKSNVKNARAAGLPVGSYHLYSSKTTAYQQFANFKSVVKKGDQDLIPVLDIEERNNKNLNMECVDKLLELLEKEYGAKPIIYTSERVYLDRFNCKKYQSYQFFIANYRRYPKAQLTIWQYTQTGKISGISGYVDFSELAKDKTVNDLRLKKKKQPKRSKVTEKENTNAKNDSGNNITDNDKNKAEAIAAKRIDEDKDFDW